MPARMLRSTTSSRSRGAKWAALSRGRMWRNIATAGKARSSSKESCIRKTPRRRWRSASTSCSSPITAAGRSTPCRRRSTRCRQTRSAPPPRVPPRPSCGALARSAKKARATSSTFSSRRRRRRSANWARTHPTRRARWRSGTTARCSFDFTVERKRHGQDKTDAQSKKDGGGDAKRAPLARRNGGARARGRQAAGKTGAEEADLRRQSPQARYLRSGLAPLRPISRSWHCRGKRRPGARPCHQNGPAMRSGGSIEAALSRRRISDGLCAQRLDQRRIRGRRGGDDARRLVLAAAAEDRAHRARLFGRLRTSRNHPAGRFRHGRTRVDFGAARMQMTSAMYSHDLSILTALERKVLWLATWTIHHANHLRENSDGVKVGGHQASSASLATIMTALYFHTLRPQDRVAVKPHAAPNFHAIQYLLGRQSREKLEDFRGYKGAQSYPSRTKDVDDVDFSTGSVGLGVAQTLFSSLAQDYVRAHGWGLNRPEGRMIALLGDAELDEGNIFEAILEGWKQGLRNCWWVVDYNRQSLDAVVREGLWQRYENLFRNFGWDVVVLKYGALQQAAFAAPGGEVLRQW